MLFRSDQTVINLLLIQTFANRRAAGLYVGVKDKGYVCYAGFQVESSCSPTASYFLIVIMNEMKIWSLSRRVVKTFIPHIIRKITREILRPHYEDLNFSLSRGISNHSHSSCNLAGIFCVRRRRTPFRAVERYYADMSRQSQNTSTYCAGSPENHNGMARDAITCPRALLV